MSSTNVHNLPLGHIATCQVCGSSDLDFIMDLGHQPPCDSLLRPEQLQEAENTYPLRLWLCRQCSLAQIDYVVAPEVLFHPNYPYKSGITPSLRGYLRSIADEIHAKIPLGKENLVIDVGSNDGTLLSGFQKYQCRILGIEPTNVADVANERGIPTEKSFFCLPTAEKILAEHGQATAVTATNMFAHVKDLGDLISGVSRLLVDGGIFLTESHYVLNILEDVQYDSIYHEHLKYYSLRSLIRLFEHYDFTVADAAKIPNYGGSIRVFAVKGRNKPQSARLQALLKEEEAARVYELDTFLKFRDQVRQSKLDLQRLLVSLAADGIAVPGIGCPGRSSTLINYCNIDSSIMPYIAEQSDSLKLGLSLPGKHIPIVDEKILFETNPEYVLMLSWHYAEPIIKKLRAKGLKSKIIMPLPTVHILDHA